MYRNAKITQLAQKTYGAKNGWLQTFIFWRRVCHRLFKEMKCYLALCPNPNLRIRPLCTYFLLRVWYETGHGYMKQIGWNQPNVLCLRALP